MTVTRFDMDTDDQQRNRSSAETDAPFAGAKAWVITDGKAGSESQARGIADAMGLDWRLIRVAPSGLAKWIAPFGRPDTTDRFGLPGSEFAPPFPEIAIAIGRRSMPYLRAVKRAQSKTHTVALLDSKGGLGIADVIWVPQHDRLRGPNVVTSLTAPHGFSPDRLDALRRNRPSFIDDLPGPRLTVLLGGRNAVYRFQNADHARFQTALSDLARHAGSVLITPSRRTHPELLEAALTATADRPRYVFDGEEANPYPELLAAGDAIVVTADSISMAAEALATGRPLLVFHPSRGSRKFSRFHDALLSEGVARKLEPPFEQFPDWTYAPRDATAEIARDLANRLNRLMIETEAGP